MHRKIQAPIKAEQARAKAAERAQHLTGEKITPPDLVLMQQAQARAEAEVFAKEATEHLLTAKRAGAGATVILQYHLTSLHQAEAEAEQEPRARRKPGITNR